jgi:hypothetical protein
VMYFEDLIANGLPSVKCEIRHYSHMPCIHDTRGQHKFRFWVNHCSNQWNLNK